MSVRAVIIGLVVGTVLAVTSAAVAAQTWSWYTDASGEASGSLASLQALEVSDARGGEGLLPGASMALKVNVTNPNSVALDIVSVTVGDLKSEDASCDDSLQDSRLRFDSTPEITVKPGDNEGVILGSIKLPRLLANSCQGRDVSAEVQLRAAYGAAG
jgi:hypothetical protein